jgi:hypothetical protein
VVKGALVYSWNRREFPAYFHIDCRKCGVNDVETKSRELIESSVEFASENYVSVVCFDNVDTCMMMSAQFVSLVSKLREQKVKVVITTASYNSLPDVRPKEFLYPSFFLFPPSAKDVPSYHQFFNCLLLLLCVCFSFP